MTHVDLGHADLTPDGMPHGGMSRRLRVTVMTGLCVAMVMSVTGCGAAHTLLGIHEAPQVKATSAPLGVDQARAILTRAFTAAHQGETLSGAAAQEAQKAAYTGEGLRAALARARLASVQPKTADFSLLSPERPRLLAVSRGFGFPRFIVAQTVSSKGGVPIVHLLTSPDALTPYRISVSAEMVPLATVTPFDPLNQGSPLVKGGGGLAVAPAALLKAYASSMAFPAKSVASLPFSADSFSGQLRTQAASVSKAVAAQATFSQVHKVVADSSYAVQQASGDVLVFGVIRRSDTFAVKSGQAVNTARNKAFVLLTSKKRVTRTASLTTLEFVVFAVHRSTGRATLVAAREQLVAGSGS